MISALQAIAIGTEAICFFYSVLIWKQLRNTSLKYLPYILGFVFLSDALGIFLTQTVFAEDKLTFNLPYYNITTTLIILGFTGLYFANVQASACRSILKASVFIFIGFYLVNILWIQPLFHALHSYSFTLGSVTICIAILCYTKQLVESDKIIELQSDPLFWISAGLFSFYLINIPYMAMFNVLLLNYMDLLSAARKVTIFLSYFMYICIFIGLLCSKRKSYSAS